MKLHIILGTRPEAIKLFPLIQLGKSLPDVQIHLTVTGQHRQMLDQFLDLAGIVPDDDLDVIEPNQTLDITTSKLFSRLPEVVARHNPDWIIVQGDTVSAFCGAMQGYHHRIPVAHVEAGLRSHDLYAPWPEEGYRQMISRLSSLHFAPTTGARDYLLAEGISSDKIHVTGNTVIESMQMFLEKLKGSSLAGILPTGTRLPEQNKKLILVTTHRRENHGEGIAAICNAIRQLSLRDDVEVILPVHQNPNVRLPIEAALADRPNIQLLPPLEYPAFLMLMHHAHFILTDSGGVQEEAPSLGKPVLVMRDTTERPEGVKAGVAKLVGTDMDRIVKQSSILLDDAVAYQSMAQAQNPYGDGTATQQILSIFKQRYQQRKAA